MKTTIENILPRQVLDLVRRAPINPMTRGAVRRITDLVVPDEIKEPKLIEDYILANIKEDRLKRIRRNIPDVNEKISFDVYAREDTYGTVRINRVQHYSTSVSFTLDELSDCDNEDEVRDHLIGLARESCYDYGPSDYDDGETYDFEETDSEGIDISDSTDNWIGDFISEHLDEIAEVAGWNE